MEINIRLFTDTMTDILDILKNNLGEGSICKNIDKSRLAGVYIC